MIRIVTIIVLTAWHACPEDSIGSPLHPPFEPRTALMTTSTPQSHISVRFQAHPQGWVIWIAYEIIEIAHILMANRDRC